MPNLLALKNSSYRVPSVAQAAGNALNMEGAQLRNELAAKKVGNYDEDRSTQQRLQEIQTEANAINSALKSGDSQQATDIYKRLGGKSEKGITITDRDVSIDYGDTVFSGPTGPMAEMFEKFSEEPQWADDPKTKAWSAARGISSKQSAASIARDKKKSGGKDNKGAALKRISDIQKAKATLEKTDMITQLLAKENPELAPYIGTSLDPEQKAALFEAWDNELDYLEESSGTTRKKEAAPTGPKVTHTFIPGQGLVEVSAQ